MGNSIIKYQRTIIAVKKKFGFLHIPAQGQELMPASKTRKGTNK